MVFAFPHYVCSYDKWYSLVVHIVWDYLYKSLQNYTNQLLPQGIHLQHRRIQERAHPDLQHQPHVIMTPLDVLHSRSNVSCKMILILM